MMQFNKLPLSISQLSSSVSMIEKWLQCMEDNDHNVDHSRFVLHGIVLFGAIERASLRKKENVKTKKLDIFL